MFTGAMNPLNLTVSQLKRAVAIKEQIEVLNRELRGILGAPANTEPARMKSSSMSAATKRKIAAAQKARWANVRRAKAATQSGKAAPNAEKKRVSSATRARLSAKLKAYWAAKKKTGKK
jgi:hypothetical protein